jgi:hypothetical protein
MPKTPREGLIKTSFWLPRPLKKRLEHAATERECDMQEIVRDALELYLAKIERTRQS